MNGRSASWQPIHTLKDSATMYTFELWSKPLGRGIKNTNVCLQMYTKEVHNCIATHETGQDTHTIIICVSSRVTSIPGYYKTLNLKNTKTIKPLRLLPLLLLS